MACKNARQVADEGSALVAGSVCQVPAYEEGRGKSQVQLEIQKQVDTFLIEGVDFIICEVSLSDICFLMVLKEQNIVRFLLFFIYYHKGNNSTFM